MEQNINTLLMPEILGWILSRTTFVLSRSVCRLWYCLLLPLTRQKYVICYLALVNGRINILQWAKGNGILQKTIKAMSESRLGNGYNGCGYGEHSLTFAAIKGGYLDTFIWALGADSVVNPSLDMCRLAAGYGQLHILLWLDMVGHLDRKHANKMLYDALRYKQFHVADWLNPFAIEDCDMLQDDVTNGSVLRGETDVLEWVLTHRGPNTYLAGEAAMECAVLVRNYRAIHMCCSAKMRFGYGPCMIAAAMEDLELLKWLHAIGCPWGGDTYDMAEYLDTDDVLDYLKANGCPTEARSMAHDGGMCWMEDLHGLVYEDGNDVEEFLEGVRKCDPQPRHEPLPRL